jgi:hypothetical protein
MQVCKTAVATCLGLVLFMASSPADAQYRLTNVVSNQVHQAPAIDPLLANASIAVDNSANKADVHGLGHHQQALWEFPLRGR